MSGLDDYIAVYMETMVPAQFVPEGTVLAVPVIDGDMSQWNMAADFSKPFAGKTEGFSRNAGFSPPMRIETGQDDWPVEDGSMEQAYSPAVVRRVHRAGGVSGNNSEWMRMVN